MQDSAIPLFSGLVPILTVLGVELVLSAISMKNLKFRKLLCGKPVILLENGNIIQENLKLNRNSERWHFWPHPASSSSSELTWIDGTLWGALAKKVGISHPSVYNQHVLYPPERVRGQATSISHLAQLIF